MIEATTDGVHWLTRTSGVRGLSAVSCRTATSCYALGTGSAVLSTTDGGHTWRRQQIGTRAQLNNISCPGAGACFVTTNAGTVQITMDGGRSWQTRPRVVASAIACPSTLVCYTAGSASLLSTADGGRTWQRQPLPDSDGKC